MERNQFLVGTFVRKTPLQMAILAEKMITVSSHPQWLKTTKPSKNNLNKTNTTHSLNTQQHFCSLQAKKKTSEHPHYPSRILMRLLKRGIL